MKTFKEVDLNPIEEANSYNQLIKVFGYTQKKFHYPWENQEVNSQFLKGFSLPRKRNKDLLKEGKITSGHARALVGEKTQEFLAKRIIEEGLSVRDTENIVKRRITQNDQIIKREKTRPKRC